MLTSKENVSTEKEIVSTRLFAVPRTLIFNAWANPDHLARWWGPNGFTNTFQEFDFKPGGNWHFIMHGPNGGDYKNHSAFVEIIQPERIVFDHISSPQFRVVATFAEAGNGTFVTFRMQFATVAECEKIKPIAIPANEQNFDRLAAELSNMQ